MFLLIQPQEKAVRTVDKIANDIHAWSLLDVEHVLLFIIVIFQIYLFLKIYKRTYALSKTFASKVEITQNETGIPNFKAKKSNKVLRRIEEAINNYLNNNFGSAVNFSIIRDIIDREIELEEEGLQQSIPTPLYLGLAATMIGIILGLWAMPGFSDANFSNSIGVLITGVKWAMTASLIGLILTTILSMFFKPRLQKLLRDKNEVISMLQAKLLPELVKADETGLTGLKSSLDMFSRKAETIVNGVIVAVAKTGKNINEQNRLLERIEKLDVTEISQANILLFERLEKNLKTLDNLYIHLNQIEKISENLKSFAERTEDVEMIAKSIDTSLKESRELTEFLTNHFKQLDNFKKYSIKAVNYTDAHFRDIIEKLTKEVENRIRRLNELSNQTDADLREIFQKISENLDKKTQEHIRAFYKAYNDAVPKFDNLNKLKLLDEIKKVLEKNLEQERIQSDRLNNLITKQQTAPKQKSARNKVPAITGSNNKKKTNNQSSSNGIETNTKLNWYDKLNEKILRFYKKMRNG
ncbi:MAG: hypothetical protein GXO49_06895 [Chlorobi bacterium]|nr:hypothetical protein [Chlorobiota bacterium]